MRSAAGSPRRSAAQVAQALGAVQLLLLLCCLLTMGPTGPPPHYGRLRRLMSIEFRDWRYARRGRALSPKQSRPDQDCAPSCLWTFQSGQRCSYRVYWYGRCDQVRDELADVLGKEKVSGWTVLALTIDNRKGTQVAEYSPALHKVALQYQETPDGPLKRVESEDVFPDVCIALAERADTAPEDEEPGCSAREMELWWRERLSTKQVPRKTQAGVFLVFKTEKPITEEQITGVLFTEGTLTATMRRIDKPKTQKR